MCKQVFILHIDWTVLYQAGFDINYTKIFFHSHKLYREGLINGAVNY